MRVGLSCRSLCDAHLWAVFIISLLGKVGIDYYTSPDFLVLIRPALSSFIRPAAWTVEYKRLDFHARIRVIKCITAVCALYIYAGLATLSQ
jgi:hypothetical protein